jgi:hypothetical protein
MEPSLRPTFLLNQLPGKSGVFALPLPAVVRAPFFMPKFQGKLSSLELQYPTSLDKAFPLANFVIWSTESAEEANGRELWTI